MDGALSIDLSGQDEAFEIGCTAASLAMAAVRQGEYDGNEDLIATAQCIIADGTVEWPNDQDRCQSLGFTHIT